MYRRGIAAAALGMALAMGLSGCFNGYQAQTSSQSEGGDVASGNVGDIALRGLIWVVPAAEAAEQAVEGMTEGTEGAAEAGAEGDAMAAATTPTATEAFLSGTIVLADNGQPDKLVSIEVPEGKVALAGEPADLKPGVPVLVGFNGTSFATLTAPEVPGSGFIPTVFTFENAGEVEVDVFIVPGVGAYANVVKDSRAAAPAETAATPAAEATPAG